MTMAVFSAEQTATAVGLGLSSFSWVDVDEYCQLGNTRMQDYGKCKKYTDKIDTECDGTLDPSDAATKGFAANRLCAIVEQVQEVEEYPWMANYTVWSGVCVHGKCKACNSYLTLESSSYVWEVDGGWLNEFSNLAGSNGRQNVRCVTTGAFNDVSTLGTPRICRNFQFRVSSSIRLVTGGVWSLLLTAAAVLFLLN